MVGGKQGKQGTAKGTAKETAKEKANGMPEWEYSRCEVKRDPALH